MSPSPSLTDYAALIHEKLEQLTRFDTCRRCLIPAPFRDTKLDEGGGCSHCTEYLRHAESVADFKREPEMVELIDQFRAGPEAEYDAIVCYSGGKDSTYLLDRFKNHYGLRVLAVTMVTGFNSSTARENTRLGTEKLGVDHLLLEPDPCLIDIYRWGFMAHSDKGLESDVCDLCDDHTRRRILQLAIERDIKMVVHGMDHFQLIDAGLTASCELLIDRDACWPAVARSQGVFRENYQLPELEQIERPPLELYPFLYLPYNEEEICEEVTDKGLVVDADPDATNCDFVFLINILELLRHGYPAYIHNISAAILQGEISIEDARQELIDWLQEYAEGCHDEQVFAGLPGLGLTLEQLLDPGPVTPCDIKSIEGGPLGNR